MAREQPVNIYCICSVPVKQATMSATLQQCIAATNEYIRIRNRKQFTQFKVCALHIAHTLTHILYRAHGIHFTSMCFSACTFCGSWSGLISVDTFQWMMNKRLTMICNLEGGIINYCVVCSFQFCYIPSCAQSFLFFQFALLQCRIQCTHIVIHFKMNTVDLCNCWSNFSSFNQTGHIFFLTWQMLNTPNSTHHHIKNGSMNW